MSSASKDFQLDWTMQLRVAVLKESLRECRVSKRHNFGSEDNIKQCWITSRKMREPLCNSLPCANSENRSFGSLGKGLDQTVHCPRGGLRWNKRWVFLSLIHHGWTSRCPVRILPGGLRVSLNRRHKLVRFAENVNELNQSVLASPCTSPVAIYIPARRGAFFRFLRRIARGRLWRAHR